MDYVIGSGPSGVACALALLRRGRAVTMIDAGGELEADRRRQVDQLKVSDPRTWRESKIDFLKEGVSADRKGVGVKRTFGSDYPYRDAERFMPTEKIGVDAKPSLGVGGFSSVWGAAILPFRQEDVPDWPFAVTTLDPHYKAVLSFLDTSMEKDDLAELFPLFTQSSVALKRSRQAEALLADLSRHRKKLKEQHICFGASRLAVRTGVRHSLPGCVYCGLCMYGCPYDLIYSTTQTFQLLESYPQFQRITGVVVTRLKESVNEVEIFGLTRNDSRPVEFKADRLYLGAGVLASTRIMLHSMQAYDQPLTLKNSQYFLLPMLRYAGVSGVMDEALHTLSQIFVEIRDAAVSKNTIHLQIYTYNDLYTAALKKMLGPARGLARPFLGAILGRLLTVQGYLHSDLSPSVWVTLKRREGEPDLLQLKVKTPEIAAADATLALLVRKLSQNSSLLRAKPVGFLLNKPDAGHGFHTGGTFPMRANPMAFESDTLGRPCGFKRVHLIDSSTFPSIPATTITFSVMANAHRIGSWGSGEQSRPDS